jgi:hypothetical protein
MQTDFQRGKAGVLSSHYCSPGSVWINKLTTPCFYRYFCVSFAEKYGAFSEQQVDVLLK